MFAERQAQILLFSFFKIKQEFFSRDKFGFASNIWACLSANITISNEPRKLPT
jgi:hypothetical protein